MLHLRGFNDPFASYRVGSAREGNPHHRNNKNDM